MVDQKYKNIFLVIGISTLSVLALVFLIWDIIAGFNFEAKTTNVKNVRLKWSVQEFKNYQSGPFFYKKQVFFVDNQNADGHLSLMADRELPSECGPNHKPQSVLGPLKSWIIQKFFLLV